jgi:transaldolase
VTRLDALYLERGQSPWIDNIRRDWLVDGTLAELVDRGVRGVTSNPSIFAKALATSALYDEAIAASSASEPEQLFEDLAVQDVRDACDVLATVHVASRRELAAGVRRYSDGFVSIEVSPRLAYDTAPTIAAARRLAERVGRDNVMIKIPATIPGLAAVRATIAEGISVNVTLIFSLERYREVMDAYLSGVRDALEAGRDVRSIASVASFFVSRVDTAADPLLAEHPSLAGTTANGQAAAAYRSYLERFARADARELLDAGAQVQRPLWASTSAKNPAYDELCYVEPLVADETVNTMPDATLEAFAARGSLATPALADPAARAALEARFDQVCSLVDVGALTNRLERDGVAAFEASYLELLETVAAKLRRS